MKPPEKVVPLGSEIEGLENLSRQDVALARKISGLHTITKFNCPDIEEDESLDQYVERVMKVFKVGDSKGPQALSDILLKLTGIQDILGAGKSQTLDGLIQRFKDVADLSGETRDKVLRELAEEAVYGPRDEFLFE